MQEQYRLTYHDQFKPGLIIEIPTFIKNQYIKKRYVIKKVYDSSNTIELYGNIWKSIDSLISQQILVVGERYKFLKIFPYKHWFKKPTGKKS